MLEKLLLEKTLCFSDFDFFLLLICFFMHDLQFFLFLSFSCKYLVSFVLISLFLKKKKLEKQIDPFIFVFTLLVLTLPELLSLVVFILSFFSVPFHLFCLFMFPLLMFNCSPYVYCKEYISSYRKSLQKWLRELHLQHLQYDD